MDKIVCSKEDQVQNPGNRGVHLVILGAGASKACCNDRPEKNGKVIPLMNDLPKVVGLEPFLREIPEDKLQNFEKLFSELYLSEGLSERIRNIECSIRDYFSSLQLSDIPTIYDYLVLSLRKKDVIATFNWDPFLVQAHLRNSRFTTNLPELLFLHGNVAVDFDEKAQTFGQTGYNQNSKPVKLLYPVKVKKYTNDPFIKDQWDHLLYNLDSAALITIFGYSAPKTDIEAKDLMSKVWVKKDRYMPEIEIINIEAEDDVRKTWQEILPTRHFSYSKSFFDSWLYNFPRRTGEMFGMKYIEGRFQESNRPPKFENMSEMWEWYSGLIKYDSPG